MMALATSTETHTPVGLVAEVEKVTILTMTLP
jgi:hypothetical protein